MSKFIIGEEVLERQKECAQGEHLPERVREEKGGQARLDRHVTCRYE